MIYIDSKRQGLPAISACGDTEEEVVLIYAIFLSAALLQHGSGFVNYSRDHVNTIALMPHTLTSLAELKHYVEEDLEMTITVSYDSL
jgi:hypothetical protein